MLNVKTSGIQSSNGLTITYNGDGSVTINGQATERANLGNLSLNNLTTVAGHKYYIECGNTTIYTSNWNLTTSEGNGNRQIVTASASGTAVVNITVFSTELVFNNVRFFPKIIDLTEIYGAGNEPTTVNELNITNGYEPYDIGSLRSVSVTEVKSVGVNLFNLTEEMLGDSYINGISNIVINNSNSITCKALLGDGQSYIIYGQRFPSGVCTCRLSTTDIGRIIVRLYNASDVIISDAFTIEGMRYNDFYKAFYADANELVINVPADVAYWRIGLYFGNVGTIETISNIQVSKGTGVPYTPYQEHTLPIPKAVLDKFFEVGSLGSGDVFENQLG